MSQTNSNSILGKKTKPQENINELLQQTEKGEEIESDFNAKTVIDLLLSIQEKLSLNLAQRKKYPNDPFQFMGSEEQLNEDISVLQKIAAYPLLIPILIENKGIELICSLLSHPNSDIINLIVNLIEEITEGVFLQEIEDPKGFLELFLSYNLFDLLVDHLKQLFQEANEDNEDYKSDILSVLENYIEIYPPSADILGKTTDILTCLLSSVKYSESFEVKLFSSEILQSLLQYSENNQSKFASMEGIPHLVNLIVELKERQTKGGSYEEFICNIVNSLCTSLFNKVNQDIFSKADGINVMIDFMMQNNIFRHLAIKVLNYALQNNKENCNSFISLNGLSVLFPYFMGKGLKKYSESVLLGEEHCIEIIVNLFKFVDGVNRDRLMYKFKEEKYQKCVRLIEIYVAYRDRALNNSKIKEDIEDSEAVNKNIFIVQLINVLCLILVKQSQLIDARNKILNLMNEKRIEIEEMKQTTSLMIKDMTDNELNNGFDYKSYLINLIN